MNSIDTLKKELIDGVLSHDAVATACSSFILSASGWRKVFARSQNEQDRTSCISQADAFLVQEAVVSFVTFLKAQNITGDIVVGRDSRPTGAILAEIVVATLLTHGITVRFIDIAAAPEIMSYARDYGGFVYISASHNPIGHNGFKFGLNNGGVLTATQINPMIADFKQAVSTQTPQLMLSAWENPHFHECMAKKEQYKHEALGAYVAFSKRVIARSDDKAQQDQFFTHFKHAVEKHSKEYKQLLLLADFNGSARSVSIDRSFFEQVGIHFFALSESPHEINHEILPEGKNLDLCAKTLATLHDQHPDNQVLLGYMPDCDGDRGNIVYFDEHTQKVGVPNAQSIFAVSVIAELSFIRQQEMLACQPEKPLAVVVNGPTSMRIEKIAQVFNAQVFRAEVGEANIVSLAEQLRQKGFTVPILGEGSNGGNITHPAAVRDPLNTIFALLKLFLLRSESDIIGLFELWCKKSGQPYKPHFTLGDIFASLPAYTTTPVDHAQAVLKVHETNHALLKRRYAALFHQQWEHNRLFFNKTLKITQYVVVTTSGTEQFTGAEAERQLAQSGKGGLKILLCTDDGEAVAFLWMRGSGTEPVFRILVDVHGDNSSIEAEFLTLHQNMVLEADKG